MKELLRHAGSTGRAMVRPARLLVALKMTVAATAAWLLGNLLPGELDEYAYYAPFGALIAMTPTIVSSLASSIKALIGVLLGLLAAWALIFMGVGGVLAVAFAVGIGTLLAGIPSLDVGREYIPLAAVFAFVVGGPNVDAFSFGFTVQLALGAGLGITVNVVLPPPLETTTAKQVVRELRNRVATVVERFADSLDDAPDEGPSWPDLISDLDTAANDAADELSLARRSRRGNIRARDPLTRVDDAESVLASLHRIIWQLHEFAHPFIVDARDTDPTARAKGQSRIPEEIRNGISIAGDCAAALIRESRDGDDRTQGDRALDELHKVEMHLSHWQASDVRLQQRVAVVTYALRQIVVEAYGQASDEQLDPKRPPWPTRLLHRRGRTRGSG